MLGFSPALMGCAIRGLAKLRSSIFLLTLVSYIAINPRVR